MSTASSVFSSRMTNSPGHQIAPFSHEMPLKLEKHLHGQFNLMGQNGHSTQSCLVMP